MTNLLRGLFPVTLLLAVLVPCLPDRAAADEAIPPPGGAGVALLSTTQPPSTLGDCTAPYGYLHEPSFGVDHLLRLPAREYLPQAGDIFLSTDQRLVAKFAHLLVKSGAPHHSGIVFAMPDGSQALLEGGPNGTRFIRVQNLPRQLESYYPDNRVWIRQRAVPLTPEQSARLSVFALTAAERPFAEIRMFSQANPALRAKGPLRTRLFGRAHAANFDPADPEPGMRRKYYCSELVTEACVAAWLLPPDTTRPTSMYPRELFFGSSRIPYIRDNLDMSAWLPPSRWTICAGVGPVLRQRPFIEGDTGSSRRSP